MSEKLWAWKLKAWLLSFAQPVYLKLLKLGGGGAGLSLETEGLAFIVRLASLFKVT